MTTIVAPAVNVQPNEVTDPALLAQLNASTEITDPAILSMLNVDSFDRLLNIESGVRQLDTKGNPITSKKGAIGAAQVMPATAPEAAKLAGVPFDVKRYKTDMDYNIKLGKAYFGKQLEDFNGDFFKASAAYNAGPGAVKQALLRSEKTGKPWVAFLPKETQGYISKLGYGSEEAFAMLPKETQDFIRNSPELTDAQRQELIQGTIAKANEVPETYVFDPRVMQGAALIGGIAGGGLAKLAGRSLLGAVESGIGGAVSGAGSSLAGQYYLEGKPKNFQNDITGIGIELASGGVPTILREIGSRGSVAAIEKIPYLGGEAGKVFRWMTGGDTEAQWALKRFTVGDPRRKGGIASDVFTKGSEKEQQDIIANAGIQLAQDIPAKEGMRQVYNNAIDVLRRQGNFFSNSTQFSKIQGSLAEAVNNRIITRQQKRIIEDVLASDKSLAMASDAYASRIDNLIHDPSKIQGLSEFTDEGNKFIRDLLKSNYNEYFVEKTGKPIFNLLKGAEEASIVAQARDSIPALLDGKFKGTSEELSQALKNIRKSPGGSEDFKTAVISYFNSLPDSKVTGEFNRLKPYMVGTKILTPGEIRKLEKGVGVRTSALAKLGFGTAVTLKDSILGTLGAEAQRKGALEAFNL